MAGNAEPRADLRSRSVGSREESGNAAVSSTTGGVFIWGAARRRGVCVNAGAKVASAEAKDERENGGVGCASLG